MAQSERHRRLFFALWPDDNLRARIEQAAGVLATAGQGRIIPARNLHVTLVFLGEVPLPAVDLALQAGGQTTAPAFDLQFDRLEYWRRSNLICLTAVQTPPALPALVNGLNARLLERSFQLRDNKSRNGEYRAHVTLVRDVARAQSRLEIAPLRWPVEEFALVDSKLGRQGSEYTVVARWPLARA